MFVVDDGWRDRFRISMTASHAGKRLRDGDLEAVKVGRLVFVGRREICSVHG